VPGRLPWTAYDLIRKRAGEAPLPEKLSSQSLRRTFASLLYALGESPAVVMAELATAIPHLRCGLRPGDAPGRGRAQ
jgi:integrase